MKLKKIAIITLLSFGMLWALWLLYNSLFCFYREVMVFRSSSWVNETENIEINIKTNKIVQTTNISGTFKGVEIYLEYPQMVYKDRYTGRPIFEGCLEVCGFNKILFHINYDCNDDYPDKSKEVITLRRKLK